MLGELPSPRLGVLSSQHQTVRYLTLHASTARTSFDVLGMATAKPAAAAKVQSGSTLRSRSRPTRSFPTACKRRGIRSPAGLCDPLMPAHSCAPAAHRMKVPEAAPFTAVLKYAAEEVPRA